ncbi:MAG: hypothetical protein ACRDDA_13615, partial [Aeromonas sp.]
GPYTVVRATPTAVQVEGSTTWYHLNHCTRVARLRPRETSTEEAIVEEKGISRYKELLINMKETRKQKKTTKPRIGGMTRREVMAYRDRLNNTLILVLTYLRQHDVIQHEIAHIDCILRREKTYACRSSPHKTNKGPGLLRQEVKDIILYGLAILTALQNLHQAQGHPMNNICQPTSQLLTSQ